MKNILSIKLTSEYERIPYGLGKEFSLIVSRMYERYPEQFKHATVAHGVLRDKVIKYDGRCIMIDIMDEHGWIYGNIMVDGWKYC